MSNDHGSDDINPPDSRAKHLAKINEVLASYGLSQLPRLGNHTKNEIEFVTVVEVYDHSATYFTDVKFSCIFPGGKTGEFTVRWNAHSLTAGPAVMVVLIDGTFALVKSFRPAIGEWLLEMPRGYGESIDKAKLYGALGIGIRMGDLPLGTMAREIGEEVLADCVISNFAYLGGIAQDSTTQGTITSYFLVGITLTDEGRNQLKERRRRLSDEGHHLRLCDYNELVAAIGTEIVDGHSITAIRLYEKHVRNLPIA